MDELEVVGHRPQHLSVESHDCDLDSHGEEGSYSEDSLSGSEHVPQHDQ